MNAIEEIMRFQFDRKLHESKFNVINESTNIVEELLEASGYKIPKENRPELMDSWINYVHLIEEECISVKLDEETQGPWERLDAYGDIIVFSIGAIAKLGYDPEKILVEIAKEINSRSGYIINGKFEKDLSEKSKAKWHKANFKNCELAGAERMQKRRKAFFAVEGYMGNEEEVEKWISQLI